VSNGPPGQPLCGAVLAGDHDQDSVHCSRSSLVSFPAAEERERPKSVFQWKESSPQKAWPCCRPFGWIPGAVRSIICTQPVQVHAAYREPYRDGRVLDQSALSLLRIFPFRPSVLYRSSRQARTDGWRCKDTVNRVRAMARHLTAGGCLSGDWRAFCILGVPVFRPGGAGRAVLPLCARHPSFL